MSGPHSAVLPDTTYVTIPAAAGLDADSALRWLIDLDVFEQAVSHSGWDAITVDGAELLNATKGSSGNTTDEINFDSVLAKGTWTVEVMHTTASGQGIITVAVGGSTVGTIDCYSGAGTTNNVRTSISSISVSATAKYRLKLSTPTKNASSVGYAVDINHVQLRRTA